MRRCFEGGSTAEIFLFQSRVSVQLPGYKAEIELKHELYGTETCTEIVSVQVSNRVSLVFQFATQRR